MTVIADDLLVRDATKVLLDRDYAWYLTDAANANGHDVPLPSRPVSFNRDIGQSGEKRKPPYLVVATPGDDEAATRHGRRYNSHVRLGVAAVVGGRTREESETRAMIHAAAIRACVMAHQDLEGAALSVEWVRRGYDLLDATKSRTLVGCEVLFKVEVQAALNLDAVTRPVPAPGTPYPDDPTVESTSVRTLERSAA